MKKIYLTLGVSIIASTLIAQSNNAGDLNKLQRIKADPSAYQLEGGIIQDDHLKCPKKIDEKINQNSSFIIHSNSQTSIGEPLREGSWLHQLNANSSQNNELYRVRKDLLIRDNKESYEKLSPTKAAGPKLSAEQRKLKK